VVLGVLGILLAFAVLNHASTEVQALDTALLYVQLGALIQQMSFVWPYPVTILIKPYGAANFGACSRQTLRTNSPPPLCADVDFISRGCVGSWTFVDHFYMQLFLVWVLFGVQLGMNLVARAYSRARRRDSQPTLEPLVRSRRLCVRG
jgi:hypothetical protein